MWRVRLCNAIPVVGCLRRSFYDLGLQYTVLAVTQSLRMLGGKNREFYIFIT